MTPQERKASVTRTMGSLFTGGGGWEAGAQEAGIVPVFGVEMDEAVAAHYASTFGPHVIVGSVTDVAWSKLQHVDVLTSSPPCQPTSNAGKQARALREVRGVVTDDEGEGSFCDPRVGLATLDAAKALTPSAVIVENSANYIGTEVFRRLREGLEALGYATSVKVLDAANYGVASGRERTILRAARSKVVSPWPRETPRVSWLSQIADLIPSMPPVYLAPWQAKALQDNPPPAGVPVLIAGGNPSRNAHGYVVHRTPEQTAWTTQKTKNTTGMRLRDANGTVRLMSKRAIARLQGFPDSYPLPESRTLAIHILGNSIPPRFARALLESVP